MATQETTLSQTLAAVEFVINQQGETKGVFLPLPVWETMLAALEDMEDLAIAKEYLIRRATARSPEEMGLLHWEREPNGRAGGNGTAAAPPGALASGVRGG